MDLDYFGAPTLKVRLNTRCLRALIDTGAEVNLVGDRLIAGQVISAAEVNVVSVTGEAIKFIGNALVDIELEDRNTICVTAKVVKDSDCLILGMPFLRKNSGKLDIGVMFLELNGRQYQVQPRPELFRCCQALLSCCRLDEEAEEQLTKALAATAEKHKEPLAEVLREYPDLWVKERIGRTHVASHAINLTERRPISCRPRRYTLDQQAIIDKEVENMLVEGFIRPSASPYASGVVLVKKKTGDWRFCIDYRPLNRVTIRDQHPLPRINDLLMSIRDSRVFIALDLRAGYWQIPVRPEDIPKTAFRTHRGLYEFTVMPFGLVNAPASFQRLMEIVFGDLRWNGVLTYLDDVLIHSPTFEGVMKLFRIVLDRLRKAGLTLRLSKCTFLPKELLYLGHIISEDGLRPNPKKLQALDDLRPPSNVSGVRSLLGFFGYFRMYIPRFAEIVEPWVALTRKGVKVWSWTEDHTKILGTLKNALAGALLAIPLEDDDDWVLETDASDIAVAAILSIKRGSQLMPVEFGSSTLSATERRWAVREKEAYAIVWALRRYDCYLRGRQITVYTDHESLQWLLAATKGKLSRWAQTLQEYDLKICYRRGSEGAHVDCLSRNPAEVEVVEDRMVCAILDRQPGLPTLDEFCEEIRREWPTTPPAGTVVRDGLYLYRGKLLVPTVFRKRLLDFYHSAPWSGHAGRVKTVKKIQRHFNWPQLHADVRDYISSCLACKRTKIGKERRQGLFRPHPARMPFEVIYIDLWGPIVEGDDRTVVLTMIDQATRWAEAAILPNKEPASVAVALMSTWFTRFGVPDVLLSDQDFAFTSNCIHSLLAHLGTKVLHSTVYHPEGNAVIESFHRWLRKGMSVLRRHMPELSINEVLQLTLMSYRASPHLVTGETPAFLLYGVDLLLPPEREFPLGADEDLLARLRGLRRVRLEALLRCNILAEQRVQKLNIDREETVFEVDDLILIREQLGGKLAPKWSLPHRVLEVKSQGKSATCRNLLTKALSEVHIQDAVFLKDDYTRYQRDQWNQELLDALSNFDEEKQDQMLKSFWRELHEGISPPLIRSAKRRRRFGWGR